MSMHIRRLSHLSTRPFRPLGMEEQVKADLAALTGKSEIAPGQRISDRQAAQNKGLARNFIAQRLKDTGIEPLVHEYSSGKNLFGVLPASQPTSEYVIIGAHYDSVRCPGASDDGTGVVATLAAAEYLSKISPRTVNVAFAFFDEEEKGLVGSKNFVNYIKGQGWNVKLANCVDMLGWDNDGDGAIELDRPSTPEIKSLYERAAKAEGIDIPFELTSAGGSDHVSFLKGNQASVCVSEEYVNHDTTPHYHKPGDTYDTINFKYLVQSTRVMCRAMQELATGAARLG